MRMPPATERRKQCCLAALLDHALQILEWQECFSLTVLLQPGRLCYVPQPVGQIEPRLVLVIVTVVQYSILQCGVVQRSVASRCAVQHSAEQNSVVWLRVAQCIIAWHSVLQCCLVKHSVVQCNVTQYSVLVQCSVAQHSVAQCRCNVVECCVLQ